MSTYLLFVDSQNTNLFTNLLENIKSIPVVNHTFANITRFFSNYSDINLSVTLIILTAICFIALHYLRKNTFLNYLSIWFGFFPVLIHELGHAFAAQVTFGQVNDIKMVLTPKKQEEIGAQGYAITSSKTRIGNIITTFMGYVSSPMMLFVGVYLVNKQMSYVFILLCLFFGLFYLVHSKQKWLPLLLIVILFLSGYNIIFDSMTFLLSSINVVYSILLGLLLGETIQSIIITTKINFNEKNTDWDGALLKQKTYIPTTFWWLVWTVLSIFSMYKVFSMLFNS